MKKNLILVGLILFSAIALAYGISQKIIADKQTELANKLSRVVDEQKAVALKMQLISTNLQRATEREIAQLRADCAKKSK